MNKVESFANEKFGEVRTCKAMNDIWFIAADICEALELVNVTASLKRLDDDEKAKLNLGFRGGATNCVNEFGLYSLVLASRKKEARDFKRWITHEVLPAIRKTGSYGKNMTTAEKIALIAQGNVELAERVDGVESKILRIETDMPLYGCEIDEVQKRVRRKGVEILGGKESEAYHDGSIRSLVYSDMYGQLKREFGCVSSYKGIKRKYLDKVFAFIDNYIAPIALAEKIANANNQMRFA